MFGGKKEVRALPTDRVHAMMRSGMSEKDIVRQLKGEGYSFGEIEKALMVVVKEGAAPLPPGAEMGIPPGPAQMREPRYTEPRPTPPAPPEEAPVREEAPAPQPEYQPAPEPQPEYPQEPQYAPAAYPQYPVQQMPVYTEDELNPQEIMEELIESVAEEKFDKISGMITGLKGEIDVLRSELVRVKEQASAKPAPEMPRELADRLDSLDVRIGGLEKAFKQLMPSLTKT